MLAAVLTEPRRFELREVPIPRVGPQDALIRVARTGICGTDIHIFNGHYAADRLPLIPGHEFTGTVADVGAQVTHLAVGQRVVADINIGCGTCFFCAPERGAELPLGAAGRHLARRGLCRIRGRPGPPCASRPRRRPRRSPCPDRAACLRRARRPRGAGRLRAIRGHPRRGPHRQPPCPDDAADRCCPDHRVRPFARPLRDGPCGGGRRCGVRPRRAARDRAADDRGARGGHRHRKRGSPRALRNRLHPHPQGRPCRRLRPRRPRADGSAGPSAHGARGEPP